MPLEGSFPGSESDDPVFAGREEGAADQVDAIRDRGEDTIEAFADSAGLTREIDDKASASDARRLPREDSGRDFLERDLPHAFPEPGHHLPANGLGRLGCDVAWSGSRSAGRDDQAAGRPIAQRPEGVLDAFPFIGHDLGLDGERAREDFVEVFADRGAAAILVFASARSIRNGNDADARGGRVHRCTIDHAVLRRMPAPNVNPPPNAHNPRRLSAGVVSSNSERQRGMLEDDVLP